MHTYIHTFINVKYIHKYINKHIHTYIYINIHTYKLSYINTYIHPYICSITVEMLSQGASKVNISLIVQVLEKSFYYVTCISYICYTWYIIISYTHHF